MLPTRSRYLAIMSADGAISKDDASAFLNSLLNKNLRVTTTDGRMFWGSFKCTDSVSYNPLPSRRWSVLLEQRIA